jgi:hypothetical protein
MKKLLMSVLLLGATMATSVKAMHIQVSPQEAIQAEMVKKAVKNVLLWSVVTVVSGIVYYTGVNDIMAKWSMFAGFGGLTGSVVALYEVSYRSYPQHPNQN